MKLISELFDEVQFLEEATSSGEKKHYLYGPCIATEQKNRNNRIYPSYINEEVNRYIREKVNNNSAWGELEHPPRATVSLKESSHRFTSLKLEGKNWIGKAVITNTPNGTIVKGLMESGGKIGISTRGVGSLKTLDNGLNEVQNDFRLITAGDVVSDPSGPNCFLNGIMENVSFFYDESTGQFLPETSENLKKHLKTLTKEERETNALRLFEQFLSKIASRN